MRIAPTKGIGYLELPEDRPVGGYCKFDFLIIPRRIVDVLPEDRPVGGYCKTRVVGFSSGWLVCCQRIDPLEGTAR